METVDVAVPVSGLFLLLLAGTGLFDLPHYLDETKDNRRLAVRQFLWHTFDIGIRR